MDRLRLRCFLIVLTACTANNYSRGTGLTCALFTLYFDYPYGIILNCSKYKFFSFYSSLLPKRQSEYSENCNFKNQNICSVIEVQMFSFKTFSPFIPLSYLITNSKKLNETKFTMMILEGIGRKIFNLRNQI